MTSTPKSSPTRKTRIVCISDTHNQTPKLPKGDVLIHAGDLAKQGSRSELKKTVDWIERADFEAKIVIAGNHDITLDAPFYAKHGSSRKWPCPQNCEENRRLLTESASITYLENEAATIYLTAQNGPGTCFKVYGSPYTPNNREWAFRYQPGQYAARQLWDAMPADVDIVVTHTPPRGHRDTTVGGESSGCEVLLRALHRVRPMLSVFGHIHEGRGAERVRWKLEPLEDGRLTEGLEVWADPGAGSSKQSLLNLSAKRGRPLDNCSRLATCQTYDPELLLAPGGHLGVQPTDDSTTRSSLNESVAGEARGRAKVMLGGAIEYRQGVRSSETFGLGHEPDWGSGGRRETVMINAAFLGPHHLKKTFNKPIIVDVDLPVWRGRTGPDAERCIGD